MSDSAKERKLRSRVRAATSALLAGTRLGNAFDALFNTYEAAQPNSLRSYLPAFTRDARFDASQYDRTELVRKIRYFARNLWLIQKLRDVHTRYAVGPNGLQVVPDGTGAAWNGSSSLAAEKFAEWCEQPGRDSLLPMSQQHKLISGETHVDGEIFILKTWRKETSVSPAVPAIQLIESHRVCSPDQFSDRGYSTRSSPSTEVVDGIQLEIGPNGKPTGRPIGYWIKDSFEDDAVPVYRSASEVIHVCNPERVGMYRGITPYASVLNICHDLDDLDLLEMERAKNNSAVSSVLKNATGEIPDTSKLRQLGLTSFDPKSQPSDEDLNKRIAAYQRVLGSRMIALRRDEAIEQLDSKNPSAATQWYWVYKLCHVCAALNIPPNLVIPELDEQGTNIRAILDDAHLGFRSYTSIYSAVARDLYRFWAKWAKNNIRGLQDPPADYLRCDVIPPRAVNVDVGRNSAAKLAEYRAGTTNLDDIAGAEGTTAEVLIEKRARNVGQIKQICARLSKEMDVEIKPEEVNGDLGDLLAKQAAPEARGFSTRSTQQPNEDEDEDEPRSPRKAARREPKELEPA